MPSRKMSERAGARQRRTATSAIFSMLIVMVLVVVQLKGKVGGGGLRDYYKEFQPSDAAVVTTESSSERRDLSSTLMTALTSSQSNPSNASLWRTTTVVPNDSSSSSASSVLASRHSFGLFDISDTLWNRKYRLPALKRANAAASIKHQESLLRKRVEWSSPVDWYLDNLQPEFSCPHPERLGGGNQDVVNSGPQWTCDPHRIWHSRKQQQPCLVYSIRLVIVDDGVVDTVQEEEEDAWEQDFVSTGLQGGAACEIHLFHASLRPASSLSSTVRRRLQEEQGNQSKEESAATDKGGHGDEHNQQTISYRIFRHELHRENDKFWPSITKLMQRMDHAHCTLDILRVYHADLRQIKMRTKEESDNAEDEDWQDATTALLNDLLLKELSGTPTPQQQGPRQILIQIPHGKETRARMRRPIDADVAKTAARLFGYFAAHYYALYHKQVSLLKPRLLFTMFHPTKPVQPDVLVELSYLQLHPEFWTDDETGELIHKVADPWRALATAGAPSLDGAAATGSLAFTAGNDTAEPGIPQRLIFTSKTNILKTKDPPLFYQNVANTIRKYRNAWGEDKVTVWFLDDNDCLQLIKSEYPSLVPNFLESIGSWKGDICRAVALYLKGGYYLDADMEAMDNPFHVVPGTDDIDFVTVMGEDGKHFFQSFLAARAGHPLIKDSIDRMVDFFERRQFDTNLKAHIGGMIGPMTLMDAFQEAMAPKSAIKNKAMLSKIQLLQEIHLDEGVYPKVARRAGRGCCCNFIVHDPLKREPHFYSRFRGASIHCKL